MKIRALLVVAIALLTALPPVAAQATREVKVGTYAYDPLIKVENWKMTGVCIDILEYIAREEDWKLEYIHSSREQCYERLAAGEIDVLAAVAYDGSAPAGIKLCREYVLVDWGQVYSHYDTDIHHIVDLEGKTIAIDNTSDFAPQLEKQLNDYRIQADFVVVSTPEEIMEKIHDGEVDAGVMSRTYGTTHKGHFNVTETPISFQPKEIGFAVPANLNADLADRIDEHLVKLKQDPLSVYHRSLNRWMGIPTARFIPPWLVWGMVAGGGLLVLLVIISMLLRSMVRLRTAELLKSNRDLQQEINERKRAEEALLDNQARYQELVDNMEGGLILVDMYNRINFANPSAHRILGVGMGELPGRTLGDYNIPDIFEGRRYFGNTRRKRRYRTTTREFEIIQRKGNRRQIIITAKPRFDEESEYTGFFGTIRDITELKQAEAERDRLEAQFRQSQKLESLGIMAGGIAHDFNNLLMGILGYADLIELDLTSTRDVGKHIQGIKTGARRASELCQQLLAYSGKGKLSTEPLDLTYTVSEMAHLLEVSISKKVTIEYRLSPELPAVQADATQLRQVIMNLITNAADAIGDQTGTVRIATGLMDCDADYLMESLHGAELPAGTYVYLDIEDTGCGMSNEEISRIFDPFYTTKFTGRGLGLAAVLGIIRGHRGVIRIRSRVGQGTTFRILLPGVDAKPVRETKEPAVVGDWQGSGLILLAEDEVSVRLVTRRMLKRLGFDVATAADGEEAVRSFTTNPESFVMVMLDLTMPVMDGEEAFRRIRSIRPEIPVVIASGYSEQEVSNRFTGRDLAGFIQKPYEYQSLARHIRSVLGE